MRQLLVNATTGHSTVSDAALEGYAPYDASLLPQDHRVRYTIGESRVLASLDFETYSEAGYTLDKETGIVTGNAVTGKGGLPVIGMYNYAMHPSTLVLCLYYDLKQGAGRKLWVPGAPSPTDLIEHITEGKLIEAWNVSFEYLIWNHVCHRMFNWPLIKREQCRCAMAKSRRHSLPGALANAAKVLGTTEKDTEGKRLITKLTRPHTKTDAMGGFRWLQHNAWDDYLSLYAYCAKDVNAEDNAVALIPDLTAYELKTWQLDQKINDRGVRVDTVALDAMLDILGQTEVHYTNALVSLTKGAVNSVAEVAKFREWLYSAGISMPDMTKESVAWALALETLPKVARDALEIREKLGSVNVKKLRTIKLQVSPDGRLRGQYMYCGADRTGRASAGGVQLQNITSKGPKSVRCINCNEYHNPDARPTPVCPHCAGIYLEDTKEWTVDAVCSALKCIAKRSLILVEQVWGDPIAVLCGCLRGLFIASEGSKLICCDFSAIEAVVAACLSRCQWRIDVFKGHAKIYEQSAANATGIPFEEILQYKSDNGCHHPARKTIGKVRELAGGYGGWVNAWKNFGADEFMNDEEIKQDVLKWRDESPEIVEMWGGQYRWCGPGTWDYRPELFGLEGAAVNAIQSPGKCFSHNDITYGVVDDILFCRLPSSRYLKYHRPKLEVAADKLGRGTSLQITFEGYNSNSLRGKVGWLRMETYGGRLFENVVQAVAADIQFDALLRCEDAGYTIVMHTHDEGTADVPEGFGSVSDMASIMTVPPEWASDWPIRAAGWTHTRYQKD